MKVLGDVAAGCHAGCCIVLTSKQRFDALFSNMWSKFGHTSHGSITYSSHTEPERVFLPPLPPPSQLPPPRDKFVVSARVRSYGSRLEDRDPPEATEDPVALDALSMDFAQSTMRFFTRVLSGGTSDRSNRSARNLLGGQPATGEDEQRSSSTTVLGRKIDAALRV